MKLSFGKIWVPVFVFISVSQPTSAQDPNFHVYLCFGQSNMCGAGTIEAKDKTVDKRFQMMEPIGCTNLKRSFGQWYDAVPPLWGCNGGLGPADYFGRTMVEKLPTTIRVGVIVVAVPGCDIALFYKTGYEGYDTYNTVPSKYKGSAYAWLLDLAKLAQKDGVIKGMLLHQGETNNGQKDWPNKVKKVYDSFISDLGLVASKTPLLVGELLYQNQGGACGGHNAIIAKVPEVIPNSYVISAEGLAGKDQFHFTTESNREIGRRYAAKMLTLLEPITGIDEGVVPSLLKSKETEAKRVAVTTNNVIITAGGGFRYGIFNLCGVLMEKGGGEGEVKAGDRLPAGTYFVSIGNDGGSFTEKIYKR